MDAAAKQFEDVEISGDQVAERLAGLGEQLVRVESGFGPSSLGVIGRIKPLPALRAGDKVLLHRFRIADGNCWLSFEATGSFRRSFDGALLVNWDYPLVITIFPEADRDS